MEDEVIENMSKKNKLNKNVLYILAAFFVSALLYTSFHIWKENFDSGPKRIAKTLYWGDFGEIQIDILLHRSDLVQDNRDGTKSVKIFGTAKIKNKNFSQKTLEISRLSLNLSHSVNESSIGDVQLYERQIYSAYNKDGLKVAPQTDKEIPFEFLIQTNIYKDVDKIGGRLGYEFLK